MASSADPLSSDKKTTGRKSPRDARSVELANFLRSWCKDRYYFRNFQIFRPFFAFYSPFSSKISLKRVAMATIRSYGLRVVEVCGS